MRLMLFMFFVTGLLYAPGVFAQSVKACGAATPAKLNTTSPENECDMFTRQLAYRKEDLKQRQLLNERREAYEAPRRQVREQYRKDIEALNAERGGVSTPPAVDDETAQREMELQVLLEAEEEAFNP